METLFSAENIIKVIGIFASIIALRKGILDNTIGKRTQHKEEYELSKKFIAELFPEQQSENNKQPHPFIIEKGYQAISGERLSHKEIKLLLGFPSPSRALKYFFRAGDLIELNSDGHFEYIKKYRLIKWRKFYKNWYYLTYFVCAMIAISPIFFAAILQINITNIESLIKLSIFVIMFIFLAISQLLEGIKIEFANYIMEEQAKLETATPNPLPQSDQDKT